MEAYMGPQEKIMEQSSSVIECVCNSAVAEVVSHPVIQVLLHPSLCVQ